MRDPMTDLKALKAKPREETIAEQPPFSEDLVRRIGCEFEKYREMREAVRRKSGALRRSLIMDLRN